MREEFVLDNLKNWLRTTSDTISQKTVLGKIAELEKAENIPVLNKSILDEDLNLTVRAVWCLKNAGIHTLGELTKITENDFIATRCIGKKSLAEIKKVLANYNLSFKGAKL